MKRLLTKNHPSFDELSAQADRPDFVATGSAIALHIIKCAPCRAIIAEIGALGESARRHEIPGAPPGLWQLIERRAADGVPRTSGEVRVEVPVAKDGMREDAPATRVGRGGTLTSPAWMRGAGLAVLVGVLVTSSLVMDSRRSLIAGTTSRMTLDREWVRPGASVVAHYRPIAALAGPPSLTIWARLETGSETGSEDGQRWYDVALVRAGTLSRVSSQDYTGTVQFPKGTQVALLAVGDSLANVLDRGRDGNSASLGVVLASDASGRPTFDALVTFLGAAHPRGERSVRERAARAMRRHYGERPETWILTDEFAHRGFIADVVKRFESRERVYYGWHDRLEPRRDLSAATEVMMANIGVELMDTARASFWIDRLSADHPTNPDLPSLWIRRIDGAPADSTRLLLERFEPIWRSARGNAGVAPAALALAERAGDSSLVQRWRGRVRPETGGGWFGRPEGPLPSDARGLDHEESTLFLELHSRERDSLPGPTMWLSGRRAAYLNLIARQRIRTRLAAIQLARGDARGSKASLDRLVAEQQAGPAMFCPLLATLRWRAEAELQLGDRDAARDDLAYVATAENWREAVVGDSAAALLGPTFSPRSWTNAKAAARERHSRCFTASRASPAYLQ